MNRFKKLQIVLFNTLIVITLCNTALVAQDEHPPQPTNMLPATGDCAMGIGANSIFNFVGNMFNNSNTNNLFVSPVGANNSIYWKYFYTNKLAFRAKLGMTLLDNTSAYSVQDDMNSGKFVDDKMTQKASDYNISLGAEKRMGSSKLQAFYGAEVFYAKSKEALNYTYGNAMTLTNTSPTTTMNINSTFPFVTRTSNRPLSSTTSNSSSIGIRAFSGIEYFIFPKISIGFEFGLSFASEKLGDRSMKNEFWDFNTFKLNTQNFDTKGSNNTNISTDNVNGQIFLLFHFSNN